MNLPAEHDVVVIGAGVSGLTAAYELRELGPLVLESTQVVGGRVSTVDVDGVAMNLGAEYWVNAPSDTYSRQVLAGIGVELSTRSDDGSGGIVAGGRHIVGEDSASLADGLGLGRGGTMDLHRSRTRIADTASRLWNGPDGHQVAADLMQCSAAEWLGNVTPKVRRFYDELACVTPGSHLEDLHALSFIVLLPAIGGTAGHQWGAEVIQGGSARLTSALAATLPIAPVLGAHVLNVDVDGESIRLAVHHEGEFHQIRARHVVVSTPAYVAAAMCSRLANWKVRALRAAWYAPWSSVDLVLEPNESQVWAGAGSVPFLDGPVSLLINEGMSEDGTRLAIRLLTGGVRLAPFVDSGVEHLESLALAQLQQVFPTCGQAVASAARTWIGGAPHLQFGNVYGSRHNIEALLAPIGNIHFCGDYMGFVDASDGGFGSGPVLDYRTTTYMSTAMRTGRRSADAVRRSMGLIHRSKDVL